MPRPNCAAVTNTFGECTGGMAFGPCTTVTPFLSWLIVTSTHPAAGASVRPVRLLARNAG